MDHVPQVSPAQRPPPSPEQPLPLACIVSSARWGTPPIGLVGPLSNFDRFAESLSPQALCLPLVIKYRPKTFASAEAPRRETRTRTQAAPVFPAGWPRGPGSEAYSGLVPSPTPSGAELFRQGPCQLVSPLVGLAAAG